MLWVQQATRRIRKDPDVKHCAWDSSGMLAACFLRYVKLQWRNFPSSGCVRDLTLLQDSFTNYLSLHAWGLKICVYYQIQFNTFHKQATTLQAR